MMHFKVILRCNNLLMLSSFLWKFCNCLTYFSLYTMTARREVEIESHAMMDTHPMDPMTVDTVAAWAVVLLHRLHGPP